MGVDAPGTYSRAPLNVREDELVVCVPNELYQAHTRESSSFFSEWRQVIALNSLFMKAAHKLRKGFRVVKLLLRNIRASGFHEFKSTRSSTNGFARFSCSKSAYLLLLPFLLVLAMLRLNAELEHVSVALFLHLEEFKSISALQTCVDSLVGAQSFELQLTLYLSSTPTVSNHPDMKSLYDKIPRDQVHLLEVEGTASQSAPFLKQLQTAKYLHKHKYLLIMRSELDATLLERTVECLCGTTQQIRSVFHAFRSDDQIEIIAPMGLTSSPSVSRESMFPHLLRQQHERDELTPVFNEGTVAEIMKLCVTLGHNICQSFDARLVSIVSGSMFWARNSDLYIEHLPNFFQANSAALSKPRVEAAAFEHVIERFIPSVTRFRGGVVVEIQPAPKPIALYSPLFQVFAEINNADVDEGFNERARPVKSKYDAPDGVHLTDVGLGSHDFFAKEVRALQAVVARKYGVYGFNYYYCWLTEKKGPTHHNVMSRVIEQLLTDGEPNIPFMFTWADDPWIQKLLEMPRDGEKLAVQQSYDVEKDASEHFEFLIRLFRHPNYIRVRGKPVLGVYRSTHVAENLQVVLQVWRLRAREYGFPGLHLVDIVDSISAVKHHTFDAIVHGFSSLQALTSDDALLNFEHSPQYWAVVTHDRGMPCYGNPTSEEPGTTYAESIQQLGSIRGREIDTGFNFVCPWDVHDGPERKSVVSWDLKFMQKLASSLTSVPVIRLDKTPADYYPRQL